MQPPSFEIFENDSGSIEVKLDSENETVWLTQKQLSVMLDTTTENIIMHLKSIYETGELEQNPTTKDFLVVQKEGSRNVRDHS